MASDNITRKLNTLRETARYYSGWSMSKDCGSDIQELIDDLARAIIEDDHATKGHPDYCPVCGSDDIEGGVFDNCDGTITQECSCLECNSSWLNVFGYSIQDNIKKGGR